MLAIIGFFCTNSAQLLLSTNRHWAEQSKTWVFLPRYPTSKYPLQDSHMFSWKPAIWWARALSVSCQHKEECAVVQLEREGFQKYYPWFSACSTEVTSSCVSGSLSNSQLHCKVTFQPKPSMIFKKKGTVSTDGCCMLATSHFRRICCICAAQAQTYLGVNNSKNP